MDLCAYSHNASFHVQTNDRDDLTSAESTLTDLRARLQAAEESTRDVTSTADSRKLVINLSKTLYGSLELDKLFQTVVREARELLDSDRATLFIVNQE